MHPHLNALFRRPQPEDLELPYRRAELAALRATLAGREQSLAELRALLHSFEGRYIRQVGVLYVQLDEWEQKLEELLDSRTPSPTATEGYWAERLAAQAEPETAQEHQPETNLRALFREVAKRIHPDFARNAHDERHRNALMAQANDALQRNDAALLQRMIDGYDPAGRPIQPTAAAELARILTLIEQARAGIEAVDAERAALTQSDMAQLHDTTRRAALEGRDHLAEMAARVKGSIGIAMGRYERESSPSRRTAPIDPDSLLSAEILIPPR